MEGPPNYLFANGKSRDGFGDIDSHQINPPQPWVALLSLMHHPVGLAGPVGIATVGI